MENNLGIALSLKTKTVLEVFFDPNEAEDMTDPN